MRTKLIQRQKDLRLTDQQFADRLGVPRTTWTALRLERYRVSLSVAKKAVAAFPDLAPYALEEDPPAEGGK
jgi:DNA-binding XRE family transcriptional regulator